LLAPRRIKQTRSQEIKFLLRRILAVRCSKAKFFGTAIIKPSRARISWPTAWRRGNTSYFLGWVRNSEIQTTFLLSHCSKKEGLAMRLLIVLGIMLAATGLEGCFWHHQAAVVTQPAPPLK